MAPSALTLMSVIGVSFGAVGRRLFTSAAAATTSSSYCAGSSMMYEPLGEEYKLDKVIVVHRHGDRAQITRSVGPSWPEDPEITQFWQTKMPSAESMKTMACTFQTSKDVQPGDDLGLGDHLFAGEDFPAYPYAMLTDMGVAQLIQVGEHLRERYVDSGYMSGEQAAGKDELYIRSTNMCRTLQSLRGLVAGLYAISGENGHKEVLHDSEALKVDTRPKSQETMFPNGGGPCSFLAQRRAEILTTESYHASTRDYSGLENKIREVLGTSDEDSVNWITLKEVTTCHRVHGREYITDITEEEEDRVSDIAGWMWGQLYNDDALNRMAIGRFLHEMTTDLTDPKLQDKKMLVYSGHDSTLVPLLCALRIYDDKWPPYASYLTLELVTRQATGERFVRACYNDETLPMLEHDAALLPYELFVGRLKQLSIDSDSYWKACEAGVGMSHSADMAQAMKSLQDEVRSTIS